MTFENLALIIGGKILKKENSENIDSFATDSRKLIGNSDSIFVAIKGTRHNSHKFLKEVYGKGIKHFIIEKGNFSVNILHHLKDTNIVEVEDSIKALHLFATHHRNKFNIPILAITGSNGKTILKEWLSNILSSKLAIVKSPKSYNSQLGVPLSVSMMENKHEYGIFEAGISKVGEMEKLAQIIKPDLGIFTNLGDAHDSGFNSRLQKAQEKTKLFKTCKKIYYCLDHNLVDKVLNEGQLKDKELISWSLSTNETGTDGTGFMDSTTRKDKKVDETSNAFSKKKANYLVKIKKNKNIDTTVTINSINSKHEFIIPFIDLAYLENAIHCLVFLINEGIELKFIKEIVSNFNSIPMRLSLKKGINGCQIIDDTYNSDINSLKVALNFMSQQNVKLKRTLILSDFLQTGINQLTLYKEISKIVSAYRIERLIGIGKEISGKKDLFSLNDKKFYKTTSSFIDDHKLKFKGELVLLKGARTFKLEKIVCKIQEKIHSTVMEVDLDAITHNLNFFRSKLKKDTKIMLMVKALAYGSSSFEVANLLEYHKVDYLGVAYADEGIKLRENGITLPIVVMNPTQETFDLLLKYNLEPVIYKTELLELFIQFLKNKNTVLSKIHLKIDTGMHRLGFQEKDINELIVSIKLNPKLYVQSIFSHLTSSEYESHDKFTIQQFILFEKMYKHLSKSLKYNPIKHILNTSGVLRFPEYQYDMVRMGIGLYGVGVEKKFRSYLEPVNTLKTVISQIKYIPQGSTIGYGRKGIADTNKKIATIAIGYADGFSRSMGNGNGKVYINGYLAPIIGNICMDMSMIDITNLDVKEGDEVIIFGKKLSVDEIAKYSNTISYEILSQVNERVKRIYIST